jgi:GH15 family glucan-1,4-alpha-glucosidase
MTGEVDLYGILLPPLLVWLGVALLASAALRWGLTRLGVYRFVWHRPLFDLALLIILLGAISFTMNRFF